MPDAIIYTSNTGHTKQYAELLGERTGMPVYSLTEAGKKLPEKGWKIKRTERRMRRSCWIFCCMEETAMKRTDRERGYPVRKKAELLLEEGSRLAPGPWAAHCKTAAECAERIAEACKDMDPEKAYVCGLLHDIGRRSGDGELRHIIEGYLFLKQLGYPEAARICITHSFPGKKLQEYVGRFDVSAQETELISRLLDLYEYDDYDRLIQLCDSIAMPGKVTAIETRMDSIAVKYGYYPPEKKKEIFRLKEYFENKMGENLYRVVCKDSTT